MFKTAEARWVAAVAAALALVTSAACSAAVPPPLGMTNKALGGASLNEYTPGVTGGVGLNNIGLLVRIWGEVTYRDDAKKFFYIDDGSRLNDGCGISGAIGVRVSYDKLASGNTFTPPSVGEFVAITGISSVTAVTVGQTTIYIRTLRTRSDADKSVYLQP